MLAWRYLGYGTGFPVDLPDHLKLRLIFAVLRVLRDVFGQRDLLGRVVPVDEDDLYLFCHGRLMDSGSKADFGARAGLSHYLWRREISVGVGVISIDHVYAAVWDLARSIEFYDRVMTILGFRKREATIGGDPHVLYPNRITNFRERPRKRMYGREAEEL